MPSAFPSSVHNKKPLYFTTLKLAPWIAPQQGARAQLLHSMASHSSLPLARNGFPSKSHYAYSFSTLYAANPTFTFTQPTWRKSSLWSIKCIPLSTVPCNRARDANAMYCRSSNDVPSRLGRRGSFEWREFLFKFSVAFILQSNSYSFELYSFFLHIR